MSKTLIEAVVGPGDLVADATVGHGRDTLFLARAVGPRGRVVGFDVLPEALEAARAMLDAEGVGARVELVRTCHSALAEHVAPGAAAVVFNLGYLPGGDRRVSTTPATTRAALEAAVSVLRVGGRLSVVVYRGHDDGAEAAAVARWADEMPPQRAHVVRYGMTNRRHAPVLYVAERRGASV